ncbi:AI-2E family transporter [Bradyrhizobium sp. 1(2017)]|jgi:predicted PurR-regulated permease PerM|uniref:AI-2E family transporter n=1 Tax=Bradyrhizobium sp. 1(2017) TaxID=1404888 RepID=UPI00140EE8A3|nr:AI-2E family transporter [Bradyrhizobium sp. 1(2017)]QIO34831.1 AI-2E family transporter [Bradyrhizobium sp. 1(2017)]
MNDTRAGQERHGEVALRDDPADHPAPRSMLATGLTLLAACVALFLVWQTMSSLLVLFAGVLFAAFLDASARALAPVVPLNRAWRLTLVLLLLAGLTGFGLDWGAGKLPEQTRLLIKVMDTQLDVVQGHLLSYGVELLGPEGGRNFSQWLLSDQGRFLSHAQFVLGGASSLLTGALVILFLGILFAFDPTSHRDSLVMLVRQSYRARTRDVMDEMGSVMRLWLVGQSIRIVLMTLCVWVALYWIGLPGPFVLGLQAGLSNFIPYLGPIVAAIPIALVAMPLGASLLIWAVVIYTIIQSIEGYVIGPLIQRQAVEIPPAWTLVAIVLLGALFGVLGIALAMPLIAIGRVAILRFYVEDWLGDDRRQRFNGEQS